MDTEPKNKLTNWWNDGDSKLKKLLFILSSWWTDGKNKLIKAVYVSLFLHFVFGIFWLLQYILI
ncbi:MAG: hypothetical protein CMN50_09035 [SAR116 cluster bacterium]|nr:hypothetical protein [SAR116 cluster bacterium]